MGVTKIFQNGISLVLDKIKIIPIIYALNISLALALTIPMFLNLNHQIGYSGVRDEMAKSFNYDWWTQFSLNADGLDETIRPSLSGGYAALFDNLELFLTGKFFHFGSWIFVFGLCYLFLAAFFNGGTIATFADEKRSFSVGRFFSYSGHYFHHFFALAVTAILAFFLVYKFLSPVIFNIIDALTVSWMSERAVWFMNLLGYVVLLCVVIFINMVFDYSKIIIVVEKKESSWLCIWLAIKFVMRHFLQTSGLYLLLSLVGLVLVLVFGFIINIINPSQMLLIIIVFLLQQIFIWTKIWARLNFYGAQYLFYTTMNAQVRKLKKV